MLLPLTNLGLPIVPVPPRILGITLDSARMEARLIPDKARYISSPKPLILDVLQKLMEQVYP